ncbi:MAG: pilus assembly protein [Elusimicrobiales bacterium]|nr:pilus assembly protein [Elusimicrobiales bacterium]
MKLNIKNMIRLRVSQAMTEVVLLFPVFMIVMFFIAKIFALLVLIQKMEIAAYYAARRWQLESHLNVKYYNWDETYLKNSIKEKVAEYIGFNKNSVKRFLNLKDNGLELEITRTQVWNVVTIRVYTNPAGIKLLCKYPKTAVCVDRFYNQYCFAGYDYICSTGKALEVVKYVPNRDRPIAFVLPGLQK